MEGEDTPAPEGYGPRHVPHGMVSHADDRLGLQPRPLQRDPPGGRRLLPPRRVLAGDQELEPCLEPRGLCAAAGGAPGGVRDAKQAVPAAVQRLEDLECSRVAGGVSGLGFVVDADGLPRQLPVPRPSQVLLEVPWDDVGRVDAVLDRLGVQRVLMRRPVRRHALPLQHLGDGLVRAALGLVDVDEDVVHVEGDGPNRGEGARWGQGGRAHRFRS